MLACARIGAIHSVVFGGFAAKELATRIDDAEPKLMLTASCGIEPGRIVTLQAAARRGDRARRGKAGSLPRPAAPADTRPPLKPGRDHDWAATGRRGQGRGQARRLRRTRRDRSALHPLHVRHDRHAQRRGARQRRPYGRAEMDDGQPLRRRSRARRSGRRSDIGWVVGHSYIVYAPLLHGCDHACSTRASRSARPTPAPSGG